MYQNVNNDYHQVIELWVILIFVLVAFHSLQIIYNKYYFFCKTKQKKPRKIKFVL